MNDPLSEVTAAVITRQIDNVGARLSGEVKVLWMKHISAFKKYVKNASKRYETTKTLLYKDRPVPLRSIYVGTKLRRGREKIDEGQFIEQLLQGNRCLISATAGAGKSFFSKWIFLKILSTEKTLPIFVELRNLNGTESGVIDYLLNHFRTSFKINLTRDLLIDLIAMGRFALILDGYDELTAGKTKTVNTELRELEVPFSKSAILITSRPGGEELGYLSDFTTYRVLPLDLAQAVSLVKKLEYDEAVKESFLRDLEKKLFEKHNDFLSNPLLLTIMLMTYGDLAEIPSKMHIFYEQAFDTLFYKHDSSKGMYRRELKCNLAIDDFRDILSCVSASSYIRGQVSLTNTDLLSYIRKAKKTTNITKLSPVAYIDDLVQSVCILLQDGTRYTYNHRSFQEYFAAFFLVHIPTDRKFDVYQRFLEREETDSSLSLAFEMNQVIVEREFVKPMLNELLDLCEGPVDLMRAHMARMKLIRKKVHFRDSDGKLRKKLDRQRYLVEEATNYWKFQVFLERMYKKKSHKVLRFGVLTKKAFDQEFGAGESEKVLLLEDGLQPADCEVLERLGILEIARRRLDFLYWLRGDIEKRDKRTGDSDLEAWL